MQDYAPNGDLYDWLDAGITEHDMRRVLGDIVRWCTFLSLHTHPWQVSGVEYLHAQGIAHRDIKPENIVLDAFDVARICDFGMATHAGQVSNLGNGTLRYMAPEIAATLDQATVAEVEQDVWSLGVLLFVMMTKHFPWDAPMESDAKYAAFVRGQTSASSLWTTLSPELLHFLRQRVFVAPHKRCHVSEFRQILSVPWFKPEPTTPGLSLQCSSAPASPTAQELAFQLISDALASTTSSYRFESLVPAESVSNKAASPVPQRKNVFRRAGQWSLKLTHHIVKSSATPLRRSLRMQPAHTL